MNTRKLLKSVLPLILHIAYSLSGADDKAWIVERYLR